VGQSILFSNEGTPMVTILRRILKLILSWIQGWL
jgi:hypothetical protein